MPFDPTKAFQLVDDAQGDSAASVLQSPKSGFDPSKPFSLVEDVPKTPISAVDSLKARPSPTMLTTIGGKPQPADFSNLSQPERLGNIKTGFTAPAIPIPKFTVKPDDSKMVAVGKEAVNLLAGIPEFMESPAGIVTLPTGGIAPKTVATLFGADALYNAGKQIVESHRDWDKYTPAQKAAAVIDIAGSVGLAGLLGYGIAKGFKPSTEGVQNADTIKSPVEDVRGEASGPAAQVASGESGEIQQPSGTQEIKAPEASVQKIEIPEQDWANIKSPHKLGVEAGLKLTEKEVPALQSEMDAANQAAKDAISKGDDQAFVSNFGKATFLSGMVEGAKREGPNYDLYAKENNLPPKQSPAAVVETPPVEATKNAPVAEPIPPEQSISKLINSPEKATEGGSLTPAPQIEPSFLEQQKQKWSNRPISYERASELEKHEYPRIDTPIFHFDELTPEEQQKTIQEQRETVESNRVRYRQIIDSTNADREKMKDEEARGVAPSGNRTMVRPMIAQKRAEALRILKGSEAALKRLEGQAKSVSTESSQKYRVGNNPTLHTIVEKLPASPVEILNKEQPVKVRNEKTGEESTVLESDLTPVSERVKPLTIYHGGPPNALESNWPKWFTTIKERASAYGKGSVFEASISPENPFFSKKTLSPEDVERIFSKGHDAIIIGSKDTPIDVIVNSKEKLNLKQSIPEKLKSLGYSDSEIASMDKAGQKALAERGQKKGKSVAKLASDWASATSDDPMELHSGIPMPKFANRKMSELDKVSSSHSAKLQKSFDEARRAQNEIKKAVPSGKRQSAISLWIQAAGDLNTLKTWESAAKGKIFKQAAKDAQNLSPKEVAIAQKAISAFDILHKRGVKYDVLKSFVDNYVPQVWKVKKVGAAFGGNSLKQRFKFSKARTFNNYFEGDQAGFVPRTLEIGKLLPAYLHEMNRVIADRQLVQDLTKATASDGLPLAAPRGNVAVVENPSGKAVLVSPRSLRGDETSDYKVMANQPALSDWTWEGKDTSENPIFVKADLALHPEAYKRLNAIIGRSAIKDWINEPSSGVAQIPKAVLHGIDVAQSAMKREMFGLLAPFHQVQEGTHAIGHLVNPFGGIPKIDLRNAEQLDAAKHGLMLLPDRASSNVYLEGVGTKSSLTARGIRKIPKVGETISDIIDGYQDYLFHQYIPGIKFKTYQAMLARNTKLYADELKSGEMTLDDVKITSAEQANAAYGHINHALLDRNPTVQHVMQLGLLAPDFLEARTRFVGQAFKGLTSKVGHEQFKAIAILASVQAGAAFIISQLLGVPYDPKHPFEVIYKGRRYAMRSVPEDIYSFLKDRRQFIYSRVNPLIVRGGVQLATGLNYRGEKVGALDTLAELLAGYIPLTARSIPGLRSLTETGRSSPVTPLEQLSGSLGLRISRYSPISETYKLAGDWMDKQGLDHNTGSYPISKYQKLRYALEDGDLDLAKSEYNELRKTMDADKIYRGFVESVNHPFTSSSSKDAEFAKSLQGYDRELYNLALEKRRKILEQFRNMKK